ncbi:hypothetical protein EON63_18860, partial [archaeon]
MNTEELTLLEYPDPFIARNQWNYSRENVSTYKCVSIYKYIIHHTPYIIHHTPYTIYHTPCIITMHHTSGVLFA